MDAWYVAGRMKPAGVLDNGGEHLSIAESDRLLRPGEAARMLGISRGTLYNWTYQRRIPAVKLGRTLRFSRLALERFIRAHTQPVRS